MPDAKPQPLRLRNLTPGTRFILNRTGDRYEFLGHKRDTPGGTQYVVRRSGFAALRTLHPSSHVRVIGQGERDAQE